MKSISKVLIANRGEIAVRVMRTAKARGIASVAVYSDADENALHVRLADEAMRIGGSAPSESYLRIEAIIDVAKRSGADAIHPGYGFLSERAEFAAACAQAGVVFIGPPPAAIKTMGDKAQAKRRMLAAGVPCIPGYHGDDQSDAAIMREADRIGFPLMVKASAGGGGRGMRLVSSKSEIAESLASARKEAQSAFGDGSLLLEKAVIGARHIEMQVLADNHGEVIHLGERDCSLQRRRQKVIEESPSPVMTPELRAAMGAAAVEAARAVGYVNAGTVEFLFDPLTGEFYFLEMNTRLQVEHPVTEMVTGLDLVALQFDIAEGKQLAIRQDDVTLNGWAIQARLYAEDPATGFLPQTGVITVFDVPGDVRTDAGVAAGDSVSAHYDPMFAKVIASGATRSEACGKLADALSGAAVFGLKTNIAFLSRLLRDPVFAEGHADTSYIEANLNALAPLEIRVSALEIALAVAALSDWPLNEPLAGWNSRGAIAFPVVLMCGEEIIAARAALLRNGVKVWHGDAETKLDILSVDNFVMRFHSEGRVARAYIYRDGDRVELHVDGVTRQFLDMTYAPATTSGAGADMVRSPMAGLVTAITANPGQAVVRGQTLATVEAMKMEHRLIAPRDGVVATVHVAVGEQVAIRTPIVSLEMD